MRDDRIIDPTGLWIRTFPKAELHTLDCKSFKQVLKSVSCDVERWYAFQQVQSHWMKIELASIPFNKLPLDERLQPIVWVSTSRNIGQHLSINKNWTTLNLYHSLKNTPRQSNRSQQSPRLRWHSKIKRKQQAKKKHFQEALHINHDHTSLNEQRSLPLTKAIEAWRKCKRFKKFLYNQLDSFRSDLI